MVCFQRGSISPGERDKYRPRSPHESEHKKIKKEDKDGHASDGEKSDQDLVVDDASEDPTSPSPQNGTSSPRENGVDRKKEHSSHGGPHSPRSGTSSNASTPSAKKMDEKPMTPVSKSVTPTGAGSAGSGSGSAGSSSAGAAVMKPAKLAALGQYAHYPHELQAAGYLPAALNSYPRPPMVYDPHGQMRAPIGPPMGSIPGGKPYVSTFQVSFAPPCRCKSRRLLWRMPISSGLS